jgi:predicted phage replisome organizer
MRRLKWIKLQLDMFNDLRIQSIRKLRKGSEYVLLLLQLKLLAASIDDQGYIYLTKEMPATVDVLAGYFSTTKPFMAKALDLFEQYDFISRDDKGMIRVLSWDEDQSCDKDQHRREQTRQRVANYRQRRAQEKMEQAAPASSPEEAATDEDPSPIKTYEEAFGQASQLVAKKLHELEQDWGSKAVCNAIHIAKQRGKAHIGYLRGILRNGGGNESLVAKNDTITDPDAYVDEMLKKAAEDNIFGVDPGVFGYPDQNEEASTS